ncbi:MAG: alpha/beta hydrolase [Actinobacteria bacterium]|nr:alpha/beta hydrolase [Actinomycetota bacterium]
MARAKISPTIELEYDTFGDPKNPALLLVMGYTAQMVAWEEEFCKMFVAKNLYVIRFDNRDCGLSTKFDGVQVDVNAVITAALMEEPMPKVPYTLSDMASDAVGLLDFLKIERAHVLGASMGGMIAQVMTIEHPTRVRSLTSVMSMSGEPEYGQSAPEAMNALLSVPPSDRDGYIAHSPIYQAFHSKKYRSDENSKRAAARDFDRSYYPQGAPRQLAAIYSTGRRTEQLRAVKTPTLVIHGKDDTLITPSGGERTAELIANAKLVLVDDMGHDLPQPLWGKFVELVSDFVSTN